MNKLKEFIQSYCNYDIKLKKWHEICLIASVGCIFFGVPLICLYLSGSLIKDDVSLLFESIIITIMGIILLGIYSAEYIRMNRGGK